MIKFETLIAETQRKRFFLSVTFILVIFNSNDFNRSTMHSSPKRSQLFLAIAAVVIWTVLSYLYDEIFYLFWTCFLSQFCSYLVKKETLLIFNQKSQFFRINIEVVEKLLAQQRNNGLPALLNHTLQYLAAW